MSGSLWYDLGRDQAATGGLDQKWILSSSGAGWPFSHSLWRWFWSLIASRRTKMTLLYVIGGVLGAVSLVYLLVALLKPEWF